jgi:leader peptidase (prepilin peptidase) / N-methyltransferase
MIVWLLLFFLIGIAVGSFLNVVADRLPSGQSVISPPSSCPGCKRQIARRDLLPVFSYLWLKGHCRYCGSVIPLRSFLVELSTGILFVFFAWYFGIGWELALVLIYLCLFITLFITDIERGILPDKIVYSGMILALCFSSTGSLFSWAPSFITDKVPSLFNFWIINALVGGAVGFIFLFVIALISRGGMGGGDIKLAGFIGLATGFPLVLVTIFLAAVAGGLLAIVLLLLKVRGRKQSIPFGPFLVVAAMITLIWGNHLLRWYLMQAHLL